jgi:hypothetical protein
MTDDTMIILANIGLAIGMLSNDRSTAVLGFGMLALWLILAIAVGQ